MKEIGCFISSHGYGHAMRMTAVLEQLQQEISGVHPHLFTTLPRKLFTPPLTAFSYHERVTDIGLVQHDAFRTNLEATLSQLNSFLPYPTTLVDELAAICKDFKLILCDISPLGIAVAQRAKVPSVLIENFTWDWIYTPYITKEPRLQKHATYLADQFSRADHHIQTEPLCQPTKTALHCGPIFRQVRSPPTEVQRALECDGRQTIFISMGGIPLELDYANILAAHPQYYFVIAGQEKSEKVKDNLYFIDKETNLYHPDIINSVDFVVCKSGYSTIAECYQAGVPLACVSRSIFPESKVMEKFIRNNLDGKILTEDEFRTGKWVEKIPAVPKRKHPKTVKSNGAHLVTQFLKPLIK